MTIRLHADDLVELLGPTDQSTSTPVTSVTSCTARVYDDAKDTYLAARAEALTAAAAAAAVQLTFASTARFAASDSVELELDDGTLHQTTIASIDSATLLTLAAGLPSAAAIGRVLTRKTHPIGATTIEVDDGSLYAIGDAVEVRQDNGSRHETTISQRHEDYVILAGALTVAATMGQRIARKLGADITMTIFNAAGAAADTEDWGYRGTLADTHAGLELGQKLRIETTLIDTSANVFLDSLRTLVEGDG